MTKTIGTFTKKFKYPYCVIREDLQKEECNIPVWLGDYNTGDKDCVYIHGTGGFRYRWLDDDNVFQIKWGRKWFNAYSIDFEFIN